VDSKYKEISKHAQIPGFRPGKIPARVLKERFADSVLDDVMNALINKTLPEAIEKEALKVAGVIKLEPTKNELGGSFEYVALLEIYPSINLVDLASEKVEVIAADVAEVDIDKSLEKLRNDKCEWDKVERAAETSDRINMDFAGTVGGKEFENNSAKNFNVILGSNRLITGFEDGLVGVKPGESKKLKLKFPDDYMATDLAGKKVEFDVTVNTVYAPQLPELDDAFAKQFNITEGGIEKLRSELRTNLERETKAAVLNVNKTRIFDRLRELNKVDVPNSLVQQEIREREHQQQQGDVRQRVQLSLLIAEIVHQNKMKVDEARVKQQIDEIAKMYQDQERVVSMYYRDKNLLNQVESVVMEEMVLEQLMSNASISTKSVTSEEAMEMARDTR